MPRAQVSGRGGGGQSGSTGLGAGRGAGLGGGGGGGTLRTLWVREVLIMTLKVAVERRVPK